MRLIRANKFEDDKGRVYFLSDDNKRHWIPSPEVAASHGWDLSTVIEAPLNEVKAHRLSFPIAFNFQNTGSTDNLPKIQKTGGINRYTIWDRWWFGSQFRGHGLEMGAASSPWPCNLNCTVDYADPYDVDEGCKVNYENKDFVPLDFLASLEDMRTIVKTDYDFMMCSHVIEHTPRVMLALKNVYEHLVEGGVFVMAVPHKFYTFDRLREVTPLSHHIEDFKSYERRNDLIHIVDYLENAHIKYAGETADITKYCRDFLAGDNSLDLHYHTFTEDSFEELIAWFNENIYPWNRCEIFQRYEGSIEFFVRLEK